MKLSTIQTILSHPLNRNKKLKALIRFFTRGVLIRLHHYPVVYPFIEKTFLVVEKGMSSAELQIYTSLYDLNEMTFLMHYLRPEDTFVDVGANVGVYSILASGVAKAKTLAFEPIPPTFRRLKRNVVYNELDQKVTLYNLGVGDKEEKLVFSDSLDAINHVIHDPAYSGPKTEIPVNSLDNILAEQPFHFLKIDVEGFEANVINGATQCLAKPELNVIIMETNGLSEHYEFGQNYIHNKLTELGFSPFNYSPYKRTLERLQTTNPQNTIYIRDYDLAIRRISSAAKINVSGELL
jgi:FkbM family methyltransferase